MTISAVKPGLQAVFASPYTPIAVINGTPVYPLSGARSGGGGIEFIVGDDEGDDPTFGDEGDDDDDDDDDDAQGDEDDDPRARRTRRRGQQDDDDPDAEEAWTPPTRDVVKRMEDALKKANGESAKRRQFGKTMKKLGIDDGDLEAWLVSRGIDPDSGDPLGDGPVSSTGEDYDPEADDEYDTSHLERPTRRDRVKSDRETVAHIMKAESRGERKAINRVTPIVAQMAAESALREAGFTGDRGKLNMALRFIDPSQVDIDIDADEFEVTGIDEQVEELKEQFPELFASTQQRKEAAQRRPTRRTGASRVDGGDRGRQPAAPQTWVERAAAAMDRR